MTRAPTRARGAGRSVALALAIAHCAWATAASAQQRERVELEVTGLFGAELLLASTTVPLRVRARNLTSRALRGEVVCEAHDWREHTVRHVSALELGAGDERTLGLTIELPRNASLACQYVVDGVALRRADVSLGWGQAHQGLVILADPPRLRGHLLDIQAELVSPGGGNWVNLPVGVVPVDAASGELLAPTDVSGWRLARMVVAHSPALERLSAPQRLALLDWVRTGGELIVHLRSPADLNAATLREVAALELLPDGAPATHVGLDFVPHGVETQTIRGVGDDQVRVETSAWGASIPLGFGHVYVVHYDGSSPTLATDTATRALIEAIAGRYRAAGSELPLLHDFDSTHQGWGAMSGLRGVHSYLDPNDSFRPALALVALLLIVYVIVVGPLNFAWVTRKNRPMLALVTTPIVAAACLALMLVFGYVGKGTQMRYRTLGLLDLVDGEARGPERRYLGLFVTRPTTFDLEVPEGVSATIVRAGGSANAAHRHVGDRVVLESLRGGLWDTIFVREDRVGGLRRGGVIFETEPRHVVRNDSEETLRGAVVITGDGSVYALGDLEPGARAQVPSAVTASIGPPDRPFWDLSDPRVWELARAMQLEDDAPAVLALSMLAGGSLARPTPALYARVDVPADELAGRFAQERARRFIRVRTRPAGVARELIQRTPGRFLPEGLDDDVEIGLEALGALLDQEPSAPAPEEEVPE